MRRSVPWRPCPPPPIFAGEVDEAVQLLRQARQIPDIPGTAYRVCGALLARALADAGDLAAAEQACAVTLAQARDTGDLNMLRKPLPVIADLDLRAGRTGDAAAHLREATQITLSAGIRFTILNVLDGCGYLQVAGEGFDVGSADGKQGHRTGSAPAGELAQVQGVRLPGQAAVPRQDPGESDPLGAGEDGLDRGGRSRWGGSGHRAPPGQAGTGKLGQPRPRMETGTCGPRSSGRVAGRAELSQARRRRPA
jgi:hypothetical protein